MTITTQAILARKVEMVEALRNMEVAAQMLVASSGPQPTLTDTYLKLGCQIQPLHDTTQIDMLCKYMNYNYLKLSELITIT